MEKFKNTKIICAYITFEDDKILHILELDHTKEEKEEFLEMIDGKRLFYHGCNYLKDGKMNRGVCCVFLKDEMIYYTRCGWKSVYFPTDVLIT